MQRATLSFAVTKVLNFSQENEVVPDFGLRIYFKTLVSAKYKLTRSLIDL